MSEFSRIQYDFNSRITLNDETTDTDKFILVDSDAFLDTVAQATEENRATDPGIVDYGIQFGKGTARIPISLYASSQAEMAQLIQNLKEAFNPDLLEADATYGEDAGKGGYHPLKWTEIVGSTSRDFQIYLKSMETPRVRMDSFAGLIRESELKLKAQDPRKYLQAESTLTGGGTATNVGTYPTPVEITIEASGASSTSLRIQNSTRSESIYITTALSSGETLVIDTRNHSCKLDGTERRDYLGSNTEWLQLDPGDNTIAISNGSNVSIETAWHSAWEL